MNVLMCLFNLFWTNNEFLVLKGLTYRVSLFVVFTAVGRLYCMWSSLESDGTLYTLLYNQDTSTDESSYYRYTCLVCSKGHFYAYYCN